MGAFAELAREAIQHLQQQARAVAQFLQTGRPS
jgi:hypothetical protein